MYCTETDLVRRYSQQELDRVLATVPVQERADTIARAIADATSAINDYVGRRYPVPLAPVPQSITMRACVIARYFLHRAGEAERIRQDYEDAIAWLRDVARGIVSLGDTATPPPEAAAGQPESSGPARIFSRDSLRGL